MKSISKKLKAREWISNFFHQVSILVIYQLLGLLTKGPKRFFADKGPIS